MCIQAVLLEFSFWQGEHLHTVNGKANQHKQQQHLTYKTLNNCWGKKAKEGGEKNSIIAETTSLITVSSQEQTHKDSLAHNGAMESIVLNQCKQTVTAE